MSTVRGVKRATVNQDQVVLTFSEVAIKLLQRIECDFCRQTNLSVGSLQVGPERHNGGDLEMESGNKITGE